MPSVLIQKMKNRKLQAGRIILNLLCYLVECGTQFGFQHHSHHWVAALNIGTDNDFALIVAYRTDIHNETKRYRRAATCSRRYSHRTVWCALGILQCQLHKTGDFERTGIAVGLEALHLRRQQPLEIAEIASEII